MSRSRVSVVASLVFAAWALALAFASRLSAGEVFDPAVQTAVDRGRMALLPKLARLAEAPPPDYPMGRVAIALAAVLKAGAPSDDPVVKRAFAVLESLPLVRTYCVSAYLFALDAYWQRRHRESVATAKASRGNTAVGEPSSRVPRDGPIRSRMEECIAWLVRGSGGTWNYTGRGPGDLSNTQFAILALEVGLDNDIPIPASVFHDIARHFSGSHSSTSVSQQFNIVYRTASWEGITQGRTLTVSHSAYLGGWNYTSQASQPPSPAMSAAGVSSLLIARKALERAGEWRGDEAWQADRKIEAGLGWMGSNWRSFLGNYYALYSFEKVGDIGGIQSIGILDWYREGSQHIVRAQAKDGTWNGTWGVEASTALALLFLTRATRSHLQTLGPPVLFTRVAGDPKGGEDSDLVYVAKLEGFVSAATVFGFLAETRDPKVLPVAKEVLAGFAPHRLDEALARLLGIWTDDRDAISSFAAEAAAKLLEIDSRDRAVFEGTLGDLRKARAWEKAQEPPARDVGEVLGRTPSPVLARRLLDLIDRTGLAEAFGAVVARLADREASLRRKARELLERWTRESFPYPAEAVEPGASRQSIEAMVKPWNEWWTREGARFPSIRKARTLVEKLDAESDPARQKALAKALVELGPGALGPILEGLDRGRYSVRLVEALELISGKSEGLRAADWHEALRGEVSTRGSR